jgi:hypothetical protein
MQLKGNIIMVRPGSQEKTSTATEAAPTPALTPTTAAVTSCISRGCKGMSRSIPKNKRVNSQVAVG